MARIRLGARPKSFKHKVPVDFIDEDGRPAKGAVEMVYTYRTRTQFGEFLDQLFGAAKVELPSPAEDDVVVSLAEALARTRDTNADYILQIAEGWDLPNAEFDRANVARE